MVVCTRTHTHAHTHARTHTHTHFLSLSLSLSLSFSFSRSVSLSRSLSLSISHTGKSNNVWLWNFVAGNRKTRIQEIQNTHVLKGHEGAVRGLAFGPHGHLLCSVSGSFSCVETFTCVVNMLGLYLCGKCPVSCVEKFLLCIYTRTHAQGAAQQATVSQKSSIH